MNINEEKELRSIIRHYIGLVKEKRLNEEKDLRSIIGILLEQELSTLDEKQTADVDPTPNKSTGINVLEDLLKKIVPVLETDYKSMTTDPEQRKSFRAHIIQAIINTLTPVEANTAAGDETSDDLAQSTGYQYIGTMIANAGDDTSLSGYLHLFDPSNTTFVKHFIGTSSQNSTYANHITFGGYGNTTSAINAIDFKAISGTLDSGTIDMYGVK